MQVRLASLSDLASFLSFPDAYSKAYFTEGTPPWEYSIEKSEEQLRSLLQQSTDITGIYRIDDSDNGQLLAYARIPFSFPRSGLAYASFHAADTLSVYECSEALHHFVRYAFLELNYNKLSIQLIEDKGTLLAPFERNGFEQEVCLREHLYRNGRYETVYQIGLTKQDFLSGRQSSLSLENATKSIDETECTAEIGGTQPYQLLLVGKEIELTVVTEEDADRLYRLNLHSDGKNYSSLAAAAPQGRDELVNLAHKRNDLLFLNDTIVFGIKKKKGELIGTISASSIDRRNRNLMLGLSILDPDDRGKGYGTEAIERMLDFAFLELNMHRVYLGCFSFHSRAAKLYEKIGFHPEGINRQFLYRNGAYYDERVFGLLRREWLKMRQERGNHLHSC
ncbi:GNAT family protein [Gorillibacterium sp. CAU 1737]|uniref:GNAT family N-acetyltransferase n=1 Tax=Gorillibacterium sp. CAU 1737 TaxID=3140362 RepID=UPI003260D734